MQPICFNASTVHTVTASFPHTQDGFTKRCRSNDNWTQSCITNIHITKKFQSYELL